MQERARIVKGKAMGAFMCLKDATRSLLFRMYMTRD
jgi:hypothetical protein